MPRGREGARKAIADINARREAAGGGGRNRFFKLEEDGDTAIVWFLESGEDIAWADCHGIPIGGFWQSGQRKEKMVPCLKNEDEAADCDGCDDDDPETAKTQYRGWINVLWEDAPKLLREKGKDGKPGKVVKKKGKVQYETDDDGDVVTEITLAVWNSGPKLFELLDEKHETYKKGGGLESRPFKVKRIGEGTSTTYSIEPADPDAGPVEMPKKLAKMLDDKADLDQFITPPDEKTMRKYLKGDFGGSNGGGGGEESSAETKARRKANPFMRNRD